MAKLGIDTGTVPDDGTGDSLLDGAVKINLNFDEIYTYFGNGSDLTFIDSQWATTDVGIHTLSNVGIGTTNPTSSLTVNGNGTFTGVVTATMFVGSLTGTSGTITTLNSTTGTITNLTGTSGTITTLNSTTGTITNLNSTTGTITNLTGTSGTITTLNSTTGTITNLTGTSGTITTLNSTTGTITNLTGTSGTITTLNSTTGTITNLNSTTGTITNLTGTSGTITNLTGTSGTITTLNSTTGTITNLTGTSGTITTLNSTTGTIGIVQVSGNIGVGTANITSRLHIGAGTTVADTAPIKLDPGQLLTVPERGTLEYDGTLIYATPNSSTRGSVSSVLEYANRSALTLVSSTADQAWLGVGISLASGTQYEFEGLFNLITTGTVSHTDRTSFGGTSTLTRIGYYIQRSVNTVTATGVNSTWTTSADATVITPNITTTQNAIYRMKGIVEIDAGGTFIPNFSFSSAPGGTSTIVAGAWFKIYPIGLSGVNVSVGNWE
jgi:hypothetical protein